MPQHPLVEQLQQIYPSERLLTRAAHLAVYESDALTAFQQRPAAVVIPENQDEVIETVKLCHQHSTPFVARGSGTSLSGGSLPLADGIVIALNRLNTILKLNPDERIAVVESGVVNLAVSRAAEPYGLYYAPDPSSQAICTIGGNIAFNSGGAHCLKYGMTSNHVLGMKVLLPDGEVVEMGGESLEGVGPDLSGLFVGSEGLFGVALEITLRLLPLPERYRTVLASYDSLEAAGDAVSAVVASGLLPGAMEIMDSLAIKAAEVGAKAGYPQDAAALIIVELEGEAAAVEAEFAHLLQVIEESGASEVRTAQTADERARIWKGRKSAFSSVGRLAPDYIVQDGVVPRGKLGRALAEIDRLGQEYGMKIANVFHAGDGNLHPLILFDGREEGALETAEELAGEIITLCVELGGSITGEHGVGMEKRDYMSRMFGPCEMDTMRCLQRAIDPNLIANRGKMLPEDGPPPHDRDGYPADESRSSTPPEESATSVVIKSISDLQEAIRAADHVIVRGGGSKSALSTPREGATLLNLSALSGVLTYDPGEFTFTARAATPVKEIVEMLAEKGQYLPFDPPLAKAGATLGGVVAAGTNGPGRYRYGGVRDFLIGIRFVDGRGQVVRGGGQVVKNAAGFDFPKLMVGSLGRLGVLTEVTFKVFPAPAAYASLQVEFDTFAQSLDALVALSRSKFEIDALDLVPDDQGHGALWIRIGGLKDALPDRLQTLKSFLAEKFAPASINLYQDSRPNHWLSMSDMAWRPQHNGSETHAACGALVRIPVTPARIRSLDPRLAEQGIVRRYSAGGQLVWLDWPSDLSRLDKLLREYDLAGLVLDDSSAPGEQTPWLGALKGHGFLRRVAAALDPDNKFGLAANIQYDTISRFE